MPKIRFLEKKSFYMILRFEIMLSVVSYIKEKTFLLMKKILILRKIILSIMYFVI